MQCSQQQQNLIYNSIFNSARK